MKRNFYLSEITIFSAVAFFFWIAAAPIKDLVFQSNVNAGGYAITNLASPIGSNDAATKAYVDANGGGMTTNASLLTTGILADSRLSTNVPLLNATRNIFTQRVQSPEFTIPVYSENGFSTNAMWKFQNFGYSDNEWQNALVIASSISPQISMLTCGKTYIHSDLYVESMDAGLKNVYAAVFNGSGSGLSANSIPVSSLSYSGATSGQVPTYDGTNVVWSTPSGSGGGSGSVTSITFSSPLTGGTITGSGTVGISQATSSSSGYLSSTDWNTFNNKLATNGSGAGLSNIPVTALSSSGASSGQVPMYNGSTIAWATPSGSSGVVDNSIQSFRLTLSSGVPVPTADVTAATTIYLTAYKGNRIALYYSSAWSIYTTPEVSASIPSNASTNSDVFVYYTGSAVALEFVAWSSNTARATALAYQDGVLVKSSDPTRRYVGTIRTISTSGQCEDSAAKRFVWNYYNRINRNLFRSDGASNWTYATSVWRAANNSNSNKVDFVSGYPEESIWISYQTTAAGNAGGYIGLGLDTTSSPTYGQMGFSAGTGGGYICITSSGSITPQIGYHYISALEYSNGSAITFYGGGSTFLQGVVRQ